MAVCQNLVPLVNIKIAGKWMFIPLKMVLIGIDPYPYWIQKWCLRPPISPPLQTRLKSKWTESSRKSFLRLSHCGDLANANSTCQNSATGKNGYASKLRHQWTQKIRCNYDSIVYVFVYTYYILYTIYIYICICVCTYIYNMNMYIIFTLATSMAIIF